MSLITKIARLKHPGVLGDFTWPSDLHIFSRFNLIYGWNGSGKTILSRVFRALEQRDVYSPGEVTLCVDNRQVTGQDFPTTTVPVRVFNRDFVNETVFPVSGGDLPPIFVIGTESVEKQKEVERLKKELSVAKTELESRQLEKQAAERQLDKYCIDRASVIRDTLRSSGQNKYNNYDKSTFRERAQEMAKAGDKESHRLSESDRGKLLAQHRASPKPKLQPLRYQLPPLKALAETASELLSTTVVSAALQTLKDDPSLSAWVRQGLGLHQQRHVDQCLFCEQALPSGRLAALEAHFNAEYERFMQRLDSEIGELNAAAQTAAKLTLPNRAEFYDDLAAEYDAAEAALRGAIRLTIKFLGSLVQVLTDKKAKAFERIELKVSPPEVDSDAVNRLNEVIQKHNQACDDFQGRVSTARERLAADFVSAALDEYESLADSVLKLENAIKNAETETKRLNEEIAKLEREIVEHRQPAEELNADLCKYLGHSELRVEIKDTGYTITRNGIPAQSLSEGEMTAIALLYFLKSLKDRRFDLAKGIVVLDDPVSSLDANALYLAFGFIRERTEDAGQLFILTHNFSFFRQVRNWFHHLKGQKKRDVNLRPAQFYMLDQVHGSDPRCTTLRALDPLLEQYESEYHYLFACVYRAARNVDFAGLEENYALPNVARRVLESFLCYRYPSKSGDLWQKMREINYDGAKKTRILRFVHTYSHSDTIAEPEHDLSALAETKPVLNELLDFIKAEDNLHFEEMEKLVNRKKTTQEEE